ncbi:MAG: hypothetical protein OXB84_06035 [Halobacteriovoraceae bacterium]|nr:hypothetical protein [Halobacteriovoraceae bacterium]
MQSNRLEVFLKGLNSELFSFSHALIPDDLQAQQLVVDAVHLLTVEEWELMLDYLSLKENQGMSISFQLKKVAYKIVFNMAKRRLEQLKGGLRGLSEYAPFFVLDINQRAVLFLKYKTNFGFKFMEEIVEKDYYQIIEILNKSRNMLLRNTAVEFKLPRAL